MTASRRLIAMLVVLAAVVAAPGAQAAAGDWSMWGFSRAGTRFNPFEHTITPQNVGRLQLKWAFVFSGADAAFSQPAVVGNTLYVGGRDGYLYALNARTGQQIWRFDTSVVTGSMHPVSGLQGGAGVLPYFGNSAATTLLRDGPAVVNGTVYFGDNKANLYALNAATGALRWHTKLDSFPDAIITSSPVLDGSRLFIGISSGEEAYGLVPTYECCQFRGSIVAVDTASKRILWRHYTTGVPRQDGVNRYGVRYLTPSGAAVCAPDHGFLLESDHRNSPPGCGLTRHVDDRAALVKEQRCEAMSKVVRAARNSLGR